MKTEKQKFEGEYYTPLYFVREVHKRLAQLQRDYLEVPTWDPAAGAQHLTKEFDYSCLASSTLNDNEADVQYDYFNEEELPEAIKCVIEQGKEMKRFNFICNPPYAAAGNNKRDGESKAGVSFTKVRELIQKEKTHTCFARNLSTQFLWRTIKFYEDNPEIEEGYIVWIDKVNYLSSSTQTKLRERLFSLFDFVGGFLIDAGHFEGIKKGSWSIGFSIFKLNRKKGKVNLDSKIENIKEYLKQDKSNKILAPVMTSPLKVKDDSKVFGMQGMIGDANFGGFSIEKNKEQIALFTSSFSNAHNIFVTKDNFNKFVSSFCARALIKPNTINSKDEYMKPFSNKPNQIFKFDILENTEEGIVKTGEKEVYNLDGGEESLGNWLRKYDKITLSEIANPNLKSFNSINVTGNKNGIKKGFKNSIGTVNFNSNAIYKNQTDVFIMSGTTSLNANIHIFKENFASIMIGFCVRCLISSNVWNEKDEYMKPSDTTLASDDYKQWSNDCIIYSLFDNQSFQSSLRQVDYQSKKWDIKNEFFWMSKEEIKDLATLNSNDKVLADIDTHNEERFVYEEIKRIREEGGFSQEALNLLDYMRNIVATTFPKRLGSEPAHHFNSWDAGYSQIKLYMTKEELKDFKELRTMLADKLRPKVYYFGFLYDPKYKHWTDDLPFIAEIDGELYDFVNQEGRVLTRSEFEELICAVENDAASCKE